MTETEKDGFGQFIVLAQVVTIVTKPTVPIPELFAVVQPGSESLPEGSHTTDEPPVKKLS
jgi:hypothetical protein